MLGSLLQSAWSQFQTNQFASGGLVLMVLGGVLALFRSVPGKIWGVVRNKVLVRVVVTSDSEAYYWVQSWLAERPYTKRTRNVQVVTDTGVTRNRRLPVFSDDEKPLPSYSLAPGEGTHVFWWRHRPVWINTSRDKNESGATGKAYIYTTELTGFGLTRQDLEDLVEESRKLHEKLTRRTAGVYISRWEDDWMLCTNVTLRPIDTLVFAPDTLQGSVMDAQRFLMQEPRYSRLGIPFRRGYLLEGPPGTGKTSLTMALAHTLQMDLCILPLSRPLLDDQMLMTLLTTLPARSVILIEDVDTIFEGRENRAGNNVTFSGLLNALDGVVTQEGHILVMTTNRADALDPALIRPGRIDVRVHVGLATKDQARGLFLRFFPGREDLADTFASNLEGSTMAQLQETLVRNINDAEAAASGPILSQYDS